MKSPILVSVIIPTYNRAEAVCEAVDNVLNQTYSNIEVIVVDDGSTDDTDVRLRKFGDRIRVLNQPNAGPAVARNHGIRASRGDIITFQDSDDLWEPTKLERQVSLLERVDKSVPCCLCDAQRIVNGKPSTSIGVSLPYEESLWLNVTQVLSARFVLFNQTVAIRREALMKVGGFDESFKKYLEDYDLSFRLAFEGPWALIRSALAIYREGTPNGLAQLARKDQVVMKECELKIFKRALNRMNDGGRDLKTGRILKWRLKLFQRALKVIELKGTGSWGARAAGSVLGATIRYSEAAFGKSPWFPKIETVPVDEWMSTHRDELSPQARIEGLS